MIDISAFGNICYNLNRLREIVFRLHEDHRNRDVSPGLDISFKQPNDICFDNAVDIFSTTNNTNSWQGNFLQCISLKCRSNVTKCSTLQYIYYNRMHPKAVKCWYHWFLTASWMYYFWHTCSLGFEQDKDKVSVYWDIKG